MDFPAALTAAVEELCRGMSPSFLSRAAETISLRYREGSGTGEPLVSTDEEALAYAIVRMPATFAAVSAALEAALRAAPGFRPDTLLDAGAGTGAAAWAAALLTDCGGVICVERERAMRSLGQRLMRSGPEALARADWIARDIAREGIGGEADLVVASYALNEMAEAERERALDALWRAAKGMLLLVEPGTPEGFRQLRAARERLLAAGAHIAAPCPGEDPCPMDEGDWCHFAKRAARGKLHKALKRGEAPYEDEKFSYMAFARFPCERAAVRVLRHPYVEKGRIRLYVCSRGGVGSVLVTKKDADAFRAARKACSGAALPPLADE